MTAFAIFKFLCSAAAMVIGTIWVKRRIVPVTSEGSTEVQYNIDGWNAVMVGVGTFVFGVALMLDALGLVSWIGEWSH